MIESPILESEDIRHITYGAHGLPVEIKKGDDVVHFSYDAFGLWVGKETSVGEGRIVQPAREDYLGGR